MADPLPGGEPKGGTSNASPGMPRWVKAMAIIALAVAATLVVVMLLVGGDHGPGRHTPGADTSSTEMILIGSKSFPRERLWA
jgi:hypothetical protein